MFESYKPYIASSIVPRVGARLFLTAMAPRPAMEVDMQPFRAVIATNPFDRATRRSCAMAGGRPRGPGRPVRPSGVPVLVAACAALLAPAAARSQAAGEWRDPGHLYDSSCTFCHDTGVGPDLKGAGWPKEYVALRLRLGFKAMPAFKPSEISDREIEALAAWLAAQPPAGR
jgi:mono/diheme cytochrome c family protein